MVAEATLEEALAAVYAHTGTCNGVTYEPVGQGLANEGMYTGRGTTATEFKMVHECTPGGFTGTQYTEVDTPDISRCYEICVEQGYGAFAFGNEAGYTAAAGHVSDGSRDSACLCCTHTDFTPHGPTQSVCRWNVYSVMVTSKMELDWLSLWQCERHRRASVALVRVLTTRIVCVAADGLSDAEVAELRPPSNSTDAILDSEELGCTFANECEAAPLALCEKFPCLDLRCAHIAASFRC